MIGINAQIRSTSGSAEGVGFAVPINSAKRSMEQLIATRLRLLRVRRDETDDLTPSLARRFGYPRARGGYHGRCQGRPAATAGLRGSSDLESVLGVDFSAVVT